MKFREGEETVTEGGSRMEAEPCCFVQEGRRS